MSDAVKLNIGRWGLVIAIFAGLAGLFGSFVILPYRMDAAEQGIKEVQVQSRVDQEKLHKIDVRTQLIDARTERMEKAQETILDRLNR